MVPGKSIATKVHKSYAEHRLAAPCMNVLEKGENARVCHDSAAVVYHA